MSWRRMAAAVAAATAAFLSAPVAGSAPAPVDPALGSPVRARITLKQQVAGTDATLFGVAFTDPLHGHVVGDAGTVLATTDGGATWFKQAAPAQEPDGTLDTLKSVSFPDASHGYLATAHNLLVTSDGGETWSVLPAPTDLFPNGAWSLGALAFSDPQRGVATGAGTLLWTADGGATWSRVQDTRYGLLMSVSAPDALHMQATGWSGPVENGIYFVTLGTADGGATWQTHSANLGADVDTVNWDGVSFTDPMHGHVVGDGGRIVATSDGGQTWTLQHSGSVETYYGVHFVDARRGVAAGTVTFTDNSQKAIVAVTDDGGQTWVSRLVPDTVRLWGGVSFADHDTAYVVGCRRDKPELVAHQSRCAEGAIVQVKFQSPVGVDAGLSSSPAWYTSPLVVGGGVLVLAVAVVLAVGLRSGRRRSGA